MKSITSRVIGVFFVLFMLASMITVGFVEKRREQERIIKSTKIFADMDEIESILYTRGTRTRKLSKQNDVWIWVDEPDIVVDQLDIKEKIEALLQITVIDKVEEFVESESYAVDNPTYSITLTDINQKATTVSLGKATKESNYYLKTDYLEDIYIVTKEVKEIIISLDSSRNLREHLDAISSPTSYR